MKTKVFLDKYDVQQIVAKHYNVEPKSVDMHLFMETVGYGLGEHDEPSIEVVVTTGEETSDDKCPCDGCENNDRTVCTCDKLDRYMNNK